MENRGGSFNESRSSSTSHISKEHRKPSNLATVNDRSRSRSWVQHPSSSAYSQRRRPRTPPNMVRETGTTRPTIARFGDSLYPEHVIDDHCKEITIPRVLTAHEKTPQNINVRSDRNSSSSDSSISGNVRDIASESQPRGPVVMYTDFQFPPNHLQELINKKSSTGSNVTQQKLSTEKNRFEQSVVRSRREVLSGNNEDNNQLSISHLM